MSKKKGLFGWLAGRSSKGNVDLVVDGKAGKQVKVKVAGRLTENGIVWGDGQQTKRVPASDWIGGTCDWREEDDPRRHPKNN